MARVRWPKPGVTQQAAGTAFVLTPLLASFAFGLLTVRGAADAVTVGSPMWHLTWLMLLGGRASLVVGLTLFARQPLRGKRQWLASLATGSAVLALAVGLAGYAVALYGPNLALLPGSEHTIAVGDQGVLAAIVTAISGGLTLSGHFLLGLAVGALALAAHGTVVRRRAVVSGAALGIALIGVAVYGLRAISPTSVVLSSALALFCYGWVAVVGIRLWRLGREMSHASPSGT